MAFDPLAFDCRGASIFFRAVQVQGELADLLEARALAARDEVCLSHGFEFESYGYGSKLKARKSLAGLFSACFHLPGQAIVGFS